ncbi:MAG: C4-dicarboxylate ABC transporter [Candidatus Aminicenantales bacterium]
MTLQVVLLLILMVIAYAAAKAKKLSVELSILAAAVAGGIGGAFLKTPPLGELPRHLVEGMFPYLDVMLIFSTASIFMAIVGESGGINYIVRGTIRTFYNTRVAALLVLMLITLIPGALTGAGSMSILVVGAPVAMALKFMGVPERKRAALLFIVAGLAAAAPPVNIYAMILCAGTAIPYVGFTYTLGIPVLILGTFTVLFYGLKKEGGMNREEALAAMPEVPANMSWWRVLLPFLTFFGMIIAYRIWPFGTPIFGLPLEFTAAGLVAYLVSPKKIDVLTLSRETVKRLLPLLATMIVVGMLQQIMTATGVRGLFSFAMISTPLVLLYILLAVIIPVSEGVLTFGAAAILGIPLVWFLNSIGLHATVVIAALSILWPLGSALPPTALMGRLSVMVSDYKGSYGSFLKKLWLPWLVITVASILMIVYSAKLSFLVRWSM